MKTRSIKTIAKLVALVAGCVIPTVSQAAPYASAVTNDSGTVSFILNEDADDVKVIHSGGAVTNEIGVLAAGSHTFPLSAVDPVKVQVAKVSGAGWKTPAGSNLTHTVNGVSIQSSWAGRLWIGDTNNPLTRYFSPRGVAVNRDPASPFFGRVYVANSSVGTTAVGGRTVGRGLYTLNADLSDSPNAYGDNAQNSSLFVASANSPWMITMGSDGYVYVADFTDANGGAFRVDGNLQNQELALDFIGGPSTVVAPNNHGSLKRIRTTGSLAGGNLVLYTMDEDYVGDPSGAPLAPKNSIWRYDIGSGPLPYQGQGVLVATPSPAWTVTGTQDFDVGTNGYIYAIQNRAANPAIQLEPGLYVIDAATGVTITNSRSMWRELTGVVTNDIMLNLESVVISPDNKFLVINLLAASIPTGSDCWIIPLVNGIPDLANRMVLDSGLINQGRGVDFDAAGNLYTISSGDAQLRVWSPGGSTTITTGNDGSFNIFTPPATVTVAASSPTANEVGLVSGVFTLTRAGDASGALTVTYGVGGDAVAGGDYTTLSGTVTFLPGATSTNITVAVLSDSESEFTETVVLTLNSGITYSLGTPASATVNILDEDTAEISISGVQTNLLEAFVDSTATFELTRKGLLSAPTTVNLSYGGDAVNASDYNGPASVTFQAGVVTTNITLTSLNDPGVEAPESFTVTIGAGAYNPGTPVSASGLVYSEDLVAGAELFADIFDTDTSPNWTINQSPDGDSEATFGFDYSAFGIPEAPNSGGTFAAQKGLKLRAHIGSDTTLTPGISVSPTGGNFTGDYRMRFDMWMNYNGPLDVGGTGSTQHSSYGLDTTGTVAIWAAGGFNDCIWFTASCEGGVGDTSASQADYGVFVASALQTAATTYYAAGTNANPRGNFNPYYSGFGRSVAPASQLGSYPSQTERVSAGGLGMAWHAVTIAKQGDNITWDIDGYRIATVAISSTGWSPLGNNVFLGFHDWFASTNGNPELQFVVYDNVRVESLAATSLTITAIEIITGGTEVKVSFSASTSAVAGDFELHKSGTVDGTYLDDPTANITGGAGSFEAVTAISPGQQFYRIFKP